jgi:hypothetical protein
MKNMPLPFTRAVNFCARLLMGLALLLLPVTSLPLFSRLMGRTTVAPASVIFIFLLGVGWFPVFLLQGGKFPGEFRIFLTFVIAALVASAAAFFLAFPPYKDYTLLSTEAKALITFAIGCAIYIIVALWHRELSQFKFALWLINIGGVVSLVWSFLQLYVILHLDGNYPGPMVQLQGLVSTRSLLDLAFRDRVGGFTYEPSWLAHQLNVLYIPYWLAATVTGFSTTRKFLRLSIENVLLVGGVAVMYFTASRVGQLALLLMLAYGLYRLNARGIRWLTERLYHRFQRNPAAAGGWSEKRIGAFLVPLVGLLYVLILIGLVYLLPLLNPRFGQLLSFTDSQNNLFEYAFQVGLAERLVYWSIGWSVFAHFPLLGVGLGNNGYFFKELLPSISHRLNEITTLLNLAGDLPNIKSMWVRLLAETGLVGFSLFVVWQYVLWQGSKFLRSNGSLLLRTLGWLGAFALIAFLAEGFSIDSFALPYLWISTGLLTAASALARRQTI